MRPWWKLEHLTSSTSVTPIRTHAPTSHSRSATSSAELTPPSEYEGGEWSLQPLSSLFARERLRRQPQGGLRLYMRLSASSKAPDSAPQYRSAPPRETLIPAHSLCAHQACGRPSSALAPLASSVSSRDSRAAELLARGLSRRLVLTRSAGQRRVLGHLTVLARSMQNRAQSASRAWAPAGPRVGAQPGAAAQVSS